MHRTNGLSDYGVDGLGLGSVLVVRYR